MRIEAEGGESGWVDLASERLGGAVLAVNDEFFAPAENLLKPAAPVFLAGQYTERGKWMDGWETRRRREPGFDWCIVRLGLPGRLRTLVVDTTHFKGNAPESCSVEACDAPETRPDRWKDASVWREVLRKTALAPDSVNTFPVTSGRATHVRLGIHPDGGVARFRALGEALPDWEALERAGGDADLAAVENGGRIVAASDEFFGSARNLLLPGRGRDMSDGWETRRRRGSGHDWVIVRMGRPGTIRRIEVDTIHFKGNAPGACSVDVCRLSEADDEPGSDLAIGASWRALLPRVELTPHALHRFDRELAAGAGEATHARLNIFPDGGVSRLRLFARMDGGSR